MEGKFPENNPDYRNNTEEIIDIIKNQNYLKNEELMGRLKTMLLRNIKMLDNITKITDEEQEIEMKSNEILGENALKANQIGQKRQQQSSLDKLLHCIHIEEFQKGQFLYHYKDQCNIVYIILQGSVGVWERKGERDITREIEIHQAITQAKKDKQNATNFMEEAFFDTKIQKMNSKLDGIRNVEEDGWFKLENIQKYRYPNACIEDSTPVASTQKQQSNSSFPSPSRFPPHSIEQNTNSKQGQTSSQQLKSSAIKNLGGFASKIKNMKYVLTQKVKNVINKYKKMYFTLPYVAKLRKSQVKYAGSFIGEYNSVTQYKMDQAYIANSEKVVVLKIESGKFNRIFDMQIRKLNFIQDLLHKNFPKANKESIYYLAYSAKEHFIYLDQPIYNEGDKSNKIYVIKNGSVQISQSFNYEKENVKKVKSFQQQKQLEITSISEGGIFGLEDFSSKNKRQYKAVGTQAPFSLIYSISKQAFEIAIHEGADILLEQDFKSLVKVKNQWMETRTEKLKEYKINEISRERQFYMQKLSGLTPKKQLLYTALSAMVQKQVFNQQLDSKQQQNKSQSRNETPKNTFREAINFSERKKQKKQTTKLISPLASQTDINNGDDDNNNKQQQNKKLTKTLVQIASLQHIDYFPRSEHKKLTSPVNQNFVLRRGDETAPCKSQTQQSSKNSYNKPQFLSPKSSSHNKSCKQQFYNNDLHEQPMSPSASQRSIFYGSRQNVYSKIPSLSSKHLFSQMIESKNYVKDRIEAQNTSPRQVNCILNKSNYSSLEKKDKISQQNEINHNNKQDKVHHHDKYHRHVNQEFEDQLNDKLIFPIQEEVYKFVQAKPYDIEQLKYLWQQNQSTEHDFYIKQYHKKHHKQLLVSQSMTQLPQVLENYDVQGQKNNINSSQQQQQQETQIHKIIVPEKQRSLQNTQLFNKHKFNKSKKISQQQSSTNIRAQSLTQNTQQNNYEQGSHNLRESYFQHSNSSSKATTQKMFNQSKQQYMMTPQVRSCKLIEIPEISRKSSFSNLSNNNSMLNLPPIFSQKQYLKPTSIPSLPYNSANLSSVPPSLSNMADSQQTIVQYSYQNQQQQQLPAATVSQRAPKRQNTKSFSYISFPTLANMDDSEHLEVESNIMENNSNYYEVCINNFNKVRRKDTKGSLNFSQMLESKSIMGSSLKSKNSGTTQLVCHQKSNFSQLQQKQLQQQKVVSLPDEKTQGVKEQHNKQMLNERKLQPASVTQNDYNKISYQVFEMKVNKKHYQHNKFQKKYIY